MASITFDLADPHAFTSGPPHEYFTYLRREDPVAWYPHPLPDGPGFWVVTKYDDVVAVSRDAPTFSSAAGGAFIEPIEGGAELMMLNQDPPLHTRLRMLVARGFTPKTVAGLELRIHAAAREIVDRVAPKGRCDFVTELASELPLIVIAELLGVPIEDRHLVFDWSNRMIGAHDTEYAATPESGQAAAMEFYAYAQQLREQRIAEPRDDIITTLITGEVDGERLDELEFNMFCLLLSVAGNETTRNLTSGGMLALLQHPDQLRLLRDDRSLLATAVDEMLRWVSPVQYFRRTATTDTEIRGQAIKQGDKVTIWYGSANRDEDKFDDPETFDVRRSPNEHLAFGGRGPHYCLGATLAKVEINAIFDEVLSRLPDMELDGEPEHLASNLINGIKHMPVRFSKTR